MASGLRLRGYRENFPKFTATPWAIFTQAAEPGFEEGSEAWDEPWPVSRLPLCIELHWAGVGGEEPGRLGAGDAYWLVM